MHSQSSIVASSATSITPFNGNQLTMSSREIAELVESRHDSVKRTVERLMDRQVIKLTPLVEVKNHLGQTVLEYNLIKRDTYIVVAQLCPEFTARLVDRWQELENRQFNIPKTLPKALRAYADEFERNQLLENKIKKDAPKVAFVEHYVMSNNSKSLRETAKILKMPEKALIDALIRDRFLFRQSGNLLPYSRPSTKAYFTVKTGAAENGHAYTQTRITAEGIAWIASRYASELMIN